jgi:hypothetical protein
VYLDCDAKKLSFRKNGDDLGIAFNDLPVDTTDGFHPGFSFYSKGDQITITRFGRW